MHGKGCAGVEKRDQPHYCSALAPRPLLPCGALITVVSQATVESLPVLACEGIRLREVHQSDAAALSALFQLPEVAQYLDPPPQTIADFGAWIALSQSRRADDRAACYSLITGKDEISGLFMALRFEERERAEIGFAMAPHLWGTGVFQKTIDLYLNFLFNDWGVKLLVGKTQVRNARAMGAMRKVGAKVIEENERNGNREYVWTIER